MKIGHNGYFQSEPYERIKQSCGAVILLSEVELTASSDSVERKLARTALCSVCRVNRVTNFTDLFSGVI